jgi:ATP-binding cassette subfamily C protein
MDSKRSGRTIRAGLLHIGVFSAIANVLILTLPLYLLQIYDRVLPAASQSTLLYISLVGLLALVVLAIIDIIRSHLAARLNQKLDVAVGDSIFLAAVNSPRAALGDVQPLRDLAVIRGFVSSRALFFLFDLPFAPFFVVLVYLIHPVLFWVTVGGAVVMVAVALLNEFASHRGSREAAEALANAFNAAQAFGRNFETVRALGMVGNATAAWGERNATALIANERVARVNSLWGGVARSLRMLLQLVTLGVGALLVLRGEMTAGMIFASSMITSRALQPLDQVVSAWRQIAESRAAYRRIRGISLSEPPVRTPLPAPTGELDVSQVVYAPPNALPNAPPLI